MILELKTTFSDTGNEELVRKYEKENNIIALQELLLRRFNNWFPYFSEQNALNVCDAQLKQRPDDPFFNLLRGMLSPNTQSIKGVNVPNPDKINYLTQAALHQDPTTKNTSAEAARQLAHFFYSHSKYIECHAWLMKAILLDSKKAYEDFMGAYSRSIDATRGALSLRRVAFPPNSLFRSAEEKATKTTSIDGLELCVFLGVILSDPNFSFYGISERRWMSQWSFDFVDTLLKAHYVDRFNAISHLFHAENAPISKIMQRAVLSDPFLYMAIFRYSHQAQIMTDEIFLAFMHYLLINAPNPKHSPTMKQEIVDLCHYTLGCFNIKNVHTRQEGCHQFQQISSNFNQYDAMDFMTLSDEDTATLVPWFIQLVKSKNQSAETTKFVEAMQSLTKTQFKMQHGWVPELLPPPTFQSVVASQQGLFLVPVENNGRTFPSLEIPQLRTK